MQPSISIIIPVRNERQTLPELMKQLLEQDYSRDRYEILIVDGQSKDGTGDLMRRRYARSPVKVRVLDNPKRVAAAGRNLGIGAATGEILVFLDGHSAVTSRTLLADTAAILERTGALCLCRAQPLDGPAMTRTGQVIAWARGCWLGRGPDGVERVNSVDAATHGAAYRRSVFHVVGEFDENFDACEDLEFTTRVWKAGIEAYTDSRLTVHERPKGTLRGLLHQMVRTGRGTSRLMRKHPDCASVAQVAPLGVLLAVLLTLAAWWRLTPVMATVVTLPLLAFPLVVAVTSCQLGLQHGFRAAWKAPWVFAGIYLGQGAGLLLEYLWPTEIAAAEPMAPLVAAEHGYAAVRSDRAA
ncbi:MAG TPA: glycosyltransferase [Rhodopila sp.]|jgi:cellulose synthase/poly-beta-1,6-N-acetylglucosamine synthase-like glycosyltransferase